MYAATLYNVYLSVYLAGFSHCSVKSSRQLQLSLSTETIRPLLLNLTLKHDIRLANHGNPLCHTGIPAEFRFVLDNKLDEGRITVHSFGSFHGIKSEDSKPVPPRRRQSKSVFYSGSCFWIVMKLPSMVNLCTYSLRGPVGGSD